MRHQQEVVMPISVLAVILELSIVLSGVQPAALADPLPPGAKARFGTTKFWHYNPIAWIGFANDKTVLTGAPHAGLCAWDVATGKKSTTHYGSYPRYSFAVSADGRRLAGNNHRDEVFTIVDSATQKELRRFAHEDLFGYGRNNLYRFGLSCDGRFLAIWDYLPPRTVAPEDFLKRRRFAVDVWDLQAGRRLHEIKAGDVAEAEFSCDGKILFAQIRGKESELRSWEIESGKERRSVGLPRSLYRFVPLPDGKSLVGQSMDRTELHLYDADTGKERRTIAEKTPIVTFAVSHDGKRVALVQGHRLLVLRLENGEKVLDVPLPIDAQLVFDRFVFESLIELIAFSPDDNTLAVANGNRVDLWNIATATKVKQVESIGGPVVAIQTHGNHLLARSNSMDLSLWNVQTGKLERRFHKQSPPRATFRERRYDPVALHFHWAGSAQAFSPDGATIAAFWQDGPIHLIDLASGRLLHLLAGSEQATCLAFSPNGKILAAPLADGRIGLWDTTTSKQIQRLEIPTQPDRGPPAVCVAIDFSADGRTLSASSWPYRTNRPAGVTTWELGTGKVRASVTGDTKRTRDGSHPDGLVHVEHLENLVVSFVPAPDSKHVAWTALRTIRILDSFTAKEVRRFGGRDVVGQSAVFSPDGKYLVAGLDNGGIRFWNADTGTVLHDVPAHSATVTSLAFADESKTLVSGSLDGTAIAWDMDHLLKKPAGDRGNLEPFWTALGQVDGEKAAQAMQALADRPAQTPAFFRERLQPVPVVDAKRLRQRLTDLQSNQFTVRQQANDELAKLGGQARLALEAELRGDIAIETRRRIEALLQKLEPPFTDADVLRSIRAIEVLERIGNADARTLLESLAAGGRGHRLTKDAREALDRLKKRQ
jgi:WD40 repeat protein